jgi:hypothetical protein
MIDLRMDTDSSLLRIVRDTALDKDTILGQLEELARSLAIEIRYESLKREGAFYTGGLCRLKGAHVMIINSNATTQDKIEVLTRAVNRFDLSGVYLRPGLREYLDRFPKQEEPSSEEE